MKFLIVFYFISTVLIFGISTTYADENNIYFISGHPLPGLYESYPVVLYRYSESGNGFERIRSITVKKQGAVFVRPYSEFGFVLIGSENGASYFQIDIVDMENVSVEKSFEIQLCNGCSYIDSHLLDEGNGIFHYILSAGKTVSGKVIRDFPGFKIIRNQSNNSLEISGASLERIENFTNVVTIGSSGGLVSGGDEFKPIFSKNGEAVYRYDKKIPQGWKLPEKLKEDDKKPIIQRVNSSAYRVISSIGVNSNPMQYYIFSKTNKNWKSLLLKGDDHWFRAYGQWIAAEPVYIPFKDIDKLNNLPRKNYSNCPDYPNFLERSRGYNATRSNKFFIMNPDMGYQFEVETKSEDSEVLSIKNGDIYYRDADEIIKSKFTHAGIKSSKILIKNNCILGVHWAFWGK